MEIIKASFRDPSGVVFRDSGVIFRRIDVSYAENYALLFSSGLYAALVQKEFLITHEEVEASRQDASRVYKIIKPELIPFISYPYEWTLTQLRDAAMLTLDIQETALRHGMSLKDASPYNVQFMGATPVFIDTLSFERLDRDKPWVAYRQFCECFLTPLLLGASCSADFVKALQVHPSGIPVELAASLLPFRCRFNLHNLIHVYWQARAKRQHRQSSKSASATAKFNLNKHLAFVDSLRGALSGLSMSRKRSHWSDYYRTNLYSSSAFEHKEIVVARCLREINPKRLLDVGANTGRFSLLSPETCCTLSIDADHDAINAFYEKLKCEERRNILPLRMDVCNPSPGIGWMHEERDSFLSRCSFDTVLALALMHHLVLLCNLNFTMLADFFSTVAANLLIEFVPFTDAQVQRMLQSRGEPLAAYTQEEFEEAFARCFILEKRIPLHDCERTLYVMKRKGSCG
ncbi:MAG: hypothetical protein AB7D37_12270 [Desulfovibrio sp.]